MAGALAAALRHCKFAYLKDLRWTFGIGEPRSHYHLVCSEKGNHAGWGKQDAEGLIFFFDKLPIALQQEIKQGSP
jgi:hypothetical protein